MTDAPSPRCSSGSEEDILERLDDQGLYNKAQRIQMIKDVATEIRRLRGVAQAEPEAYRETVKRVAAAREKRLAQLREALESIAAWRKVNTQGEYEHGLRDIIRSITDCAAAALETSPVSSTDREGK